MYRIAFLLRTKSSGGYCWEFLGGGVPPGSPNPHPNSGRKMSFSTPVFRPDLENPYPFSDLAFRKKLCHYYLGQGANKQNSPNSFRIRIFLFLSYSFGIERISSPENHTRFQTELGKVNTREGPKTIPFRAAHTFMTYIREYPPGGSYVSGTYSASTASVYVAGKQIIFIIWGVILCQVAEFISFFLSFLI